MVVWYQRQMSFKNSENEQKGDASIDRKREKRNHKEIANFNANRETQEKIKRIRVKISRSW